MRKWLASCTLAFSFLASAGVGFAAPAPGTDYEVLSSPRPTSDPSKIVVTEFFSYQCPHCYQFSPLINSWVAKLPSDVVFERIPVSFGRPDWASIGQAFYSLQAMNKLDAKMDAAIFNAIHEQHIRLGDLSSITDWLTKQGINGSDFAATYNSFSIKMSMNRAEQAAPANNVDGVPTLIIDGKYKVLGADHMSQLTTAEQLIAMVRAARHMPAPVAKTAAATPAQSPADNKIAADAKHPSVVANLNSKKKTKAGAVAPASATAAVSK